MSRVAVSRPPAVTVSRLSVALRNPDDLSFVLEAVQQIVTPKTFIDLREPVRPVPRVSVVIPTKNEAENLRYVLPLLPADLFEVLIVDANSTDGTAAVAQDLYPSARVIIESRKGKGAALHRGFIEATGDFVVALDADGSADPREIPAFIGALEAGADVAKGTRFRQGGGTSDMEPHRMLGNWCLQTTVNTLFSGQYSDLCYGYFAVRQEVISELFGEAGEADGFEIETFINIRALRQGLSIREVPSFEFRRIEGASNLHAVRDGLRILRTIVKELIRRPLVLAPS